MADPGNRESRLHPAPVFEDAIPGFQRISTRNERAHHRFDYWRALHPDIDIDPVGEDTDKDFQAELLHYAAPDGAAFSITSNDDVVARFAKPEREFVMFSLTLSGSAQLMRGSDTAHVFSAQNGFLALDSTRPLTTTSKSHKHLHLAIPRARVTAALGDNPDLLSNGFLVLPPTGIAELLKSHLVMIAREGQWLNARGVEAAVRCGVDLALETLAQAYERTGHAAKERSSDSLHAAACRYISLHLDDSTLTSTRIADAIGCSRAHLNRAFAKRGDRIGESIRYARMEAACKLLVSAPHLAIEQVAYSCGFENASSFARAFRDFSDMPPSAYRETWMPRADS